MIMSVLISGSVFASEKSTESKSKKAEVINTKEILNDGILTYDEAVAKALENNSNMENLEDSVEYLEDTKSKLVQSVDYVTKPEDSTVVFVSSTISLAALKQINTLDTNLSNVKYNKQMISDASEYMVKTCIIQIKSSEKGLELAQKGYDIASKNYDNTKVKFDLGMVSQTDFDNTKKSLEQNKSQIESLKLSIESLYTTLNNLLGVKAEERYSIEYDPTIEDLELYGGIDSYVSRKISSDPYIKIKDAGLSDSKFSLNTYSYDGATDSYISKENAVKTASRDLADAKDSMDKEIRNTYNSLLQLKENEKALNAALSKAETEYDVAKSNLAVGKTIQLDVDQKALNVESAKNDLKENTYKYETARFAFEHPFLLVSSK